VSDTQVKTNDSPDKKKPRPLTTIARGRSSGRVSQQPGSLMGDKGGLGYIARRGVDNMTSLALQTLEGVLSLAATQPLQLLSLLPTLVPEVDMADWNFTCLGCGAGCVRLKAMTVSGDGSQEEDAEGTLAIEALLNSLPQEVGSWNDALAQNVRMVLYSGMAACEAVPGPRNTGIAAIYPINTLTLRFKREGDGTLGLYQRQYADPNGLGIYAVGMSGMYTPLPQERVFWAKMGGLPDELYGRAPFAPAINAVLIIISFLRDLTLAWHRVGTPKWDVGFDLEGAGRMATEIVGLTDPVEINEFIQTKFNDTVALFNNLQPDDAFFHDINSKVNAVGAGDAWANIKEIWELHRSRLTKALKQLPALMGDMEGTTETWSEVEERIFFTGMDNLMQTAVKPFVAAANLHLQLLGMPLICEAEISIPQPTKRLEDAQAEAIEILNAIAKRDQGWLSNEEACMAITGSAPVEDPPEPVEEGDAADGSPSDVQTEPQHDKELVPA
jgi:hypothetical protein